MFKLHQKFRTVGSSPIFEDVEIIDKDGFVTTVNKVNQPALPKPELFNMKKMIEAGVNLEQVNTKILDGDLTPIVEELNSPIENNTNPNNDGE